MVNGSELSHSIIDTNYDVWVAGRNNYGQLGFGNLIDRTTWTQITDLKAVNVDAGIDDILFIGI